MWSPQGSWPWESQETDEAPNTEGWSPVSRASSCCPTVSTEALAVAIVPSTFEVFPYTV